MSVAFIDQQRAAYGVEPICRVLPIAPSTYFRHKLLDRNPSRRSRRALGDDVLRAIILQGATLSSQWVPLAVMALWGGLSFLIALKWFRWS